MIDYSAAGEFIQEVRAFAMIESAENPHQVGDGGRAYGLLQMHPATFKRYYGCQSRWAASVSDTWSRAFIKACAAFLNAHNWRAADEATRHLIVQAWNLGEAGVFIDGQRNPDYLTRWLEAYEKTQQG